MAADFRLRTAAAGDARALHRLAVRSKAHWGYSADFMAECHEELRIDVAQLDSGLVTIAFD